MRAAQLVSSDGRLEIVDRPDPVPGPGEVILRVEACGICGSDLHAIRALAPAGTVMGHEFSGEIVATGADVDTRRWREGTAVVARPMSSCGSCPQCGAGRPDRCAAFGLIGNERPGAWAELVAVPARELYQAPASVSLAEAALVEPLAVASRALHRAGDVTGEHVLVLGGGPVGLAVALWARALDAATVVISEPDESRRDVAQGLGLEAIDPGAIGPGPAFADLAGQPPGVVVECVGKAGLIQDAMLAAGFEARVVVVGVCPMPDTFLPWFGLSKELDLRFALYYEPADFVRTIDALDRHQLVVDGLVTDSIGLDQLPARFAEMVEQATGGKVLVRPGQ